MMNRYFQRFLGSRHFIELRLIRNGDVRQHWLRGRDVNEAAMNQLALMNDYGWNIFAGVNPRPHSCADVAEVVTFHADVDGEPTYQGNIPAPTLIVNSGHGFHLYWELERAEVPCARLADINRGLAGAVGADPHCCDLTRILRVPGMVNHKEPKTKVTLELDSEKRYRKEEFEEFVRPLGVGDSGAAANPHKEMRAVVLADAIKGDAYLRRAWSNGFGDGASDSRHIAILRLNGLGFEQSVIEELVGSHRWFNKNTKRVTPREKAIADVRRVLSKV